MRGVELSRLISGQMSTKYDVFISYRRDGGAQYARILQLMLSQRGYSVFLDYDELRDGNFNEKIKKAIKEAPVFMMVLSENSMNRCVNESDWVRREIMMAIEEGKHIIPVNPDNTFDGIPENVPDEIKDAIGQNQHSEISFGQALGVMVDLMIKDRFVPTLGQRFPLGKVDTDFDTAKETLKRIDAHNRFLKRLCVAGVLISITIILATCFYVVKHQMSIEQEAKKQEVLANKRAELEREHSRFPLLLSNNLTLGQMEAVDDILDKMVSIANDTIWMSQFEFTIGQWCGIMGETYNESQKDFPMTNKSKGEIDLLIIGLNDMVGFKKNGIRGFDLPSTDLWEYAAHSGMHNDTFVYAGSNDIDAVGWYRENSEGYAHPSDGQQDKWPNQLNLYDMSGNVGEWCNTPFVSGIDNAPYTVCGGDYKSPASMVTVSSKYGIDPDSKNEAIGFRLIIDKRQH